MTIPASAAPAAVTLTPKGERFAIEHSESFANGEAFLDPLTIGALPLPKSLRKLRRLREEAEAEVQRLLAIMDRIDGDADVEDHPEADADFEPSLGADNVTPGRVMVDGNAIWPGQTAVVDAGMDQSSWATAADGGDYEGEHDGGEPDVDDEDGHDAEYIDADELGFADSDAMKDPTLGMSSAHIAGFDGRGRRIGRRLLDQRGL